MIGFVNCIQNKYVITKEEATRKYSNLRSFMGVPVNNIQVSVFR